MWKHDGRNRIFDLLKYLIKVNKMSIGCCEWKPVMTSIVYDLHEKKINIIT